MENRVGIFSKWISRHAPKFVCFVSMSLHRDTLNPSQGPLYTNHSMSLELTFQVKRRHCGLYDDFRVIYSYKPSVDFTLFSFDRARENKVVSDDLLCLVGY